MKPSRRRIVILFVLLMPALPVAQKPLTFDAASVKRSNTGRTDGGVGLRPPNRYAASNVLLRTILVHAYRLKRFQVLGGPDWIDTERFDIDARAPEGTSSQEDLFQMVRSLLADRFQLATHREVRELPIYALVEARTDQRMGPQLKSSDVDCAAPPNPCGMSSTSFTNGGGTLSATGKTLDDLATTLGGMTDRAVVNRTRLSGKYQMDLNWGTDGLGSTQSVSDLPPLFTAIQEQLGLRLEPSRGPVEVLVIDHIERPTEN
jgi:uncharacterized protein (TIGR03435 family)